MIKANLTPAELAAKVERFREFAEKSLGISPSAWSTLEHSMLYGRTHGKSAALAMSYGGAHTGRYSPGDYFQAEARRMAQMSQNESNETRFRSFAERYVLARAHMFREGHEEEDQWTCMLNAKSAYRKIEAMGRGITNEDEAMRDKHVEAAQQAGQQAYGFPGSFSQVTQKMLEERLKQDPAMLGHKMHQQLEQVQKVRTKLPSVMADSKAWTGFEEVAKIHDETTYRYRGGKWGKRK